MFISRIVNNRKFQLDSPTVNNNVPPWLSNEIPKISEILPNIYLTGAAGLRSEAFQELGITLIVNVTQEIGFPTHKNYENIKKLRIPVSDLPWTSISPFFDKAAEQIDKELKENKGKVLIHCAMGSSRSTTICLAYMMKKLKMPLRPAYNLIKKARPIVFPNVGFWKQLIGYEKKIMGKNTVRMVYAGGFAPKPDIE